MTEIVMVDIDKINPYANNPRINDATVKRLVGLIPKVGFDVPLVLDRENRIIKGHARYKAAKELGIKKLPCIYSDNPDSVNDFDRIADNKVHEFTTWDEEQRAHEIDMIDTDYDFSELGLSTGDMSDIGFDMSDVPEDENDIGISEEERRQKLLAYLSSKNKELLEAPVITSEADIERARKTVTDVARAPETLVKVHCKHWGKELFVRKDKYIEL